MNMQVTVLIPTYNSRIFLDQCLQPLLNMDYPNYDIIIVDDCSSDGTIRHIEQYYPKIRITQLQKRSGHSAACNAGIFTTKARYVYIVEHHTIVTKEALSRLMLVMNADNDAAICYSKQLNMYSEHNTVVEGKRYAHYIVNQQCERNPLIGEGEEDENEPPVDVTSAGTFSYLIDKEKFQEIGYFDEDYFIHINDYELTLRVKAAALKCYYVPASITYHKSFVSTASDYNFRGGEKYPVSRTFFIARNRWLLLLSYYSLKTLVLLSPALAIYELALIGFVIRRGVFMPYLKAVYWLFTHPALIIKKRRYIQRVKRVKDTSLFVAGELNFVPGLTQSTLERIIIRYLTKFLTMYWNFTKIFL
ncbi:MAG: glycosyltransferase family 2 protein [Deltaproteobacteria bacterium]|nr:glycosyltransferase family 2 protein [Deltaproteobacteria bacterium]